MNTFHLYRRHAIQLLRFVGALTIVFLSATTAHAATNRPITCGDGAGEMQIEEAEYISEIPIYKLEQALGGTQTVSSIGEYIILVYQYAVGLIGILAVLLIMFGGYRWVTAAGNEQVISSAKETIISAVSGLVIALLSFSILQFINPRLTELDLSVAQIPAQFACDFDTPVTEPIPSDIPGVQGNGVSACPGLSAALAEVAEKMRTDPAFSSLCSDCTINVRSGYRSSEKQNELYECYLGALENGVKDGSSCPSGCGTCNLACQPCGSSHEIGKAVDVCLSGVTQGVTTTLGSSCADAGGNTYLRAVYNGGGKGDKAVPGLAENQELLKEIMTSTGKFTIAPTEWWHFNYRGSCEVDGATCNNGQADGAYCVGNTGTDTVYSEAQCSADNKATCPVSPIYNWRIISSGCDDTDGVLKFYSFDGISTYGGASDVFADKPICKTLDKRGSTFGPKF